jgi:hypothetical protein
VNRAVARRSRTRSIVEEILGGPPVRELPPPVIAALSTLAGAQERRYVAVTQTGLE